MAYLSDGSATADDFDMMMVDNFKPVFKKYKRRDKALDLSSVVDLLKYDDISLVPHDLVTPVKPIVPCLTPIAGLKPAQDWSIFHFQHHPGFYVIRNPFLPGSQRYWVSRCLQELPPPPNVTNLAVHPDLDPASLWSNFVADFQHRNKEAYNSSCPLRKLRWTTIGYHYNWTTKEYKAEEFTPFPPDLGVLSQYVARVLGFPEFQAEAGIINYYHHDSTLAAHTDHSELHHRAPLVSISFGQDAIFLMGGDTKAQSPTPVMLHSGDICVMSGDARLAYHAVPRILPSPTLTPPPCFHLRHQDWAALDASLTNEDGGSGGGDGGGNGVCGAAVERRPDDFEQTVEDESCGRDRKQVSVFENTVEDDGGVVDKTQVGVKDNGCVMDKSRIDDFDQTIKDDGVSCGVLDKRKVVDVDVGDDTCRGVMGDRNMKDFEDDGSVLIHTKDNCEQDINTLNPQCDASDFHTDSYEQDTDKLTAQCDLHTDSYERVVSELNPKIISTLRDQDWGPFAVYLSSSRINVNIRQVLKPGQNFPCTHTDDQSGHCKKPRIQT